ncbi:hypothetical protein WA026_005279 [Henosepilachna vigintioctopunctata]|uniref:CUE domain-containing protein n=1 Tax=Henosepilachna vigintioctopunctata TaxID=420089 RepID=A0AAW1UMM8_9CUCU
MSKHTQMLAEQETKIKDSLLDFVKTHIPTADLNLVDEIILSYAVAILEDISTDPAFDVEEFCDMMSAYFPEFESINHSTVYQWMFELEAQLRNDQPEEKHTIIDISLPEIPMKPKVRNSSISENSDVPKRIHKLSEMSDGSSVDSSCCDFPDEMDVLQEMFPHVCSMEVKHCLTIASGDIERATQILIDRQENGQSMTPNNSLTIHVNKATINDTELKNRIIERYSYVDKDAFTKEHRPVAPKVEPKKLVRYRDNKIVSLKGERFTEVKKGEDVDDVSLKKNKKGQTP